MNKKYVMVRTVNAGVFAGFLAGPIGEQITLTDARRIWYWSGAATLSQLACRGTSKPLECKFPQAVPVVHLLGVCEVIEITPEAKASIESVPVWSA